MITSDSTAVDKSSLTQAAALLILLGEESSGLILKELEQDEVRMLTREMIHI